MGSALRQLPLLLDWTIPVSYCSRARQFATKNLLSQPFQSTEGMVPDVSLGLTEHLRNLIQRIAFDEVQPKSLLLVFRQGSEHLLQVQFSQD